MESIVLTNLEGKDVIVFTDKICAIEATTSGTCTWIYLDGKTVMVKETPEEIIRKIEK